MFKSRQTFLAIALLLGSSVIACDPTQLAAINNVDRFVTDLSGAACKIIGQFDPSLPATVTCVVVDALGNVIADETKVVTPAVAQALIVKHPAQGPAANPLAARKLVLAHPAAEPAK